MDGTSPAPSDGLIDARQLVSRFTVEELAAKADELVRSMEDPWALLAKPNSSLREAPEILMKFGMVLGRLAPLPGMTVLDFGAGSCWTTHFMAQLGCKVIAMDISEAMLDLGKQRFAQQPLFGSQPEPEFLVFDGRHMDLADGSVDRILCFDALHHVPNPADVIAEMGRVLRPGGIAAFAEPGPDHSRDAQSQHEMRRYGVPELDLVVEEIWEVARRAGFADLSLGIYGPPQWVQLESFSSFVTSKPALLRLSYHPKVPRPLRRAARLAGEFAKPASARVALSNLAHMRGELANRRMFLMRKQGTEVVDSREVSGLRADIVLQNVVVETKSRTTTVSAMCVVRNTGENVWLASSGGLGAVRLGLRVRHGDHPAYDHGRVPLPGDKLVMPNEQVEVQVLTELPTPAAGDLPMWLEVDLVSEGIAWFATVQQAPQEIAIPPCP
ncbi:MAG: class I SAM-dependent methyltransferase [Acidimicrobiales bacterium]